jgi:hypothetical protein
MDANSSLRSWNLFYQHLLLPYLAHVTTRDKGHTNRMLYVTASRLSIIYRAHSARPEVTSAANGDIYDVFGMTAPSAVKLSACNHCGASTRHHRPQCTMRAEPEHCLRHLYVNRKQRLRNPCLQVMCRMSTVPSFAPSLHDILNSRAGGGMKHGSRELNRLMPCRSWRIYGTQIICHAIRDAGPIAPVPNCRPHGKCR